MAARSPKVHTDNLAAIPLKALKERNDLHRAAVDEVQLGCANQAGEDIHNHARMAALEQRRGRLGLATMCVEVGHAVSLVLERA
jgi:acetyl-CoA acetyltransferase